MTRTEDWSEAVSGSNGRGETEGAANGLPAGLTGEVRALIEMMGRGGIADLALETPGVKLRLRAHELMKFPSRAAGAVGPATLGFDGATMEDAPDDVLITAPMIGTFYYAPTPGDPPFVNVGDPVEAGQTIGIIEAMKIMNEIPAEHAGVVAEFLAANGQPVEYGQPLLRLEPVPAD